MSRRILLAGVLGAVVIAVVVTVVGTAGPASPPPPAGATAEVARRDLTRTQTLTGVLAYTGTRGLPAAKQGIVTALPAAGDDLTSGEVLMQVDDRPVVLLHGSVPAWRDLHAGVPDGPDVQQLEAALRHLGYGTGTPDTHWGSGTTVAVKAFQSATGAAADGAIGLGEVVFAAGDVHVAGLDTTLGSVVHPGTQVMTVQDTNRVVLVDVDPLDKNLIAVGAPVDVSLPGGDRLAGVTASVGTTLEPGADGEQMYKVAITLVDPQAVQDVALAPVVVRYRTTVATGVLSVPVTAIAGTPGGGYAVDVAGPDGVRRVPVEVGAWGDGFVEISGDVAPGEKVEVPS